MNLSDKSYTAVKLILSLRNGKKQEIVKSIQKSCTQSKTVVKLNILHQTLKKVQSEANDMLTRLVEEEKTRPVVNVTQAVMDTEADEEDGEGDDDDDDDDDTGIQPVKKKHKS